MDASAINAAVGFAKRELNIDKNVRIDVESHDLADGLNGYVIEHTPTFYDIVLDCKRDVGHIISTLFHEMIHVNQYLKKNLTEAFDPSIPYLERWWEIEAIEGSRDLMKKYIMEVSNA